MKSKMKAILRSKYGTPEVLRIDHIEKPIPKANELLIKVHCTTVNRTDCGILTGRPFLIRFFVGLFSPRDTIPGTDFAGEVVAKGNEVTAFNVGDRVFGLHDEGLKSQAEFMTIGQEKAVAKIPESISYTEAVASAEGAHYAINFLNKIKIEKGTKVLVNGATGAIGSAAIQLLQVKGAVVTAVCDTKNVPLIKALGVEKVIDYKKEDFTTSDEKFPFVLDAVGKSRFTYCKKIMTIYGVYVSSELGPNWENVWLAIIKRNKSKQRVIFPVPVDCRKSIRYMSQLLEQKQFSPLIDRIYPMDDVHEAYKYVMTGMKTGNVILKTTE